MLESKCPFFSFVRFRQIPFFGRDRKIAAPGGGEGRKEGTARKKFCGGIEGTTKEGRVGRGSHRPKEKEETQWLVGPAEMEINSPISLRAFLSIKSQLLESLSVAV